MSLGIITKEHNRSVHSPLGKKCWHYTILLLALYLIIHWTSYNNVAPFCYLLFALGIALTFIKMSWGFYFYLVISMFSDDTVPPGSIHLVSLGPFTIAIYWTLFMLFMMIGCYLKRPKSFGIQKYDKYILGIMSLYAIAGLVGAGNFFEYPREYISDASYILNLAIAYFFIRIWITKEEQIKRLVSLIIISYGIKATVGVVFYHVGIGMPAGPNLRVIFESGRVILGLVFLLCFSFLFLLRKMNVGHKILTLLFAMATLFHLISFGSRGSSILTVFGLLLFFAFLWVNGYKLQVMKYVVVMLILIVLCLGLINIMRPGAVGNVAWKLSTLAEYDMSKVDGYTSLSVISRLMECLNIFYTELDENCLIWGRGLGGWFSDEYYPFGKIFTIKPSFPLAHFATRRFMKPHGTPLVLFLKMGIGGFLVYYFIMFLFLRRGYILFRRISDLYWKAVVLGFVVALPFFYYKNFMSKLQIFLGVILAILANIEALNARKSGFVKLKQQQQICFNLSETQP